MKLVAATEETVTLHLSNDELETIISAYVWALGGLEELLERDIVDEYRTQVEADVDKHYKHLGFLRKLAYVRREQ